jgi:putative flavoprotein involved in K+ transport
MNSSDEADRIPTVIIGAGQAGLATGYHLARRGRPFVILEAGERIGDNWRCRWDTLRLYSPAMADALPGMRFPASRMSFPTKGQMADFLESYADRFGLPVRTGVRASQISRDGDDGYLVHTATGAAPHGNDPSRGDSVLRCDNVVVATGTFGGDPSLPEFAADLDPRIGQWHSSEYVSPAQLRPGAVLVVGASHSGADIAFEAASAGHPTVLSGRVHGEVPFDIEGRAAYLAFPLLLALARHVLTVRTPLGRRMRREIRFHGGPLIRVKRADLAAAGVELVDSRTVGMRHGRPVLDGGRVVEVANVVWCTGFKPDFSWLDLPVTDPDGWPREHRGVVPDLPGLYFAGLAFQYAFASMLVAGAGRDAAYIARHLATHRSAPRRAPALSPK